MKSFLLMTLAAVALSAGGSAFASLQPDAPGEAFFSRDNTIYISGDAAEAIYGVLDVEEVDLQDMIKPDFQKKARGIVCRRPMGGAPTQCTIKINKSGVAK